MRILITGGAGYIGYSLVNQLEKNASISKIIVFDNLSNSNNNFFLCGAKLVKTTFIKGDILNLSPLNKLMNDIDVVVHLAAEVSFPYNNEDHYKYEQINQYGSLNFVKFLENKKVQKIIYLSSAAIYGFQDDCVETTTPNPVNAYGRSKLIGEQYFQLLENDTKLYILRSANVFGYNPCMRTDAVINQFFLDSLMFGKIRIFGNGEQRRAFVYIKSLIDNIEECVVGNKEKGIYNLFNFNSSLNDIRDFLKEKLISLEYTYVANSSNYQSNSMGSVYKEKEIDSSEYLTDFYNEIVNQFRLKI